MSKNFFKVVADLYRRLPLYAVYYTRVVEINEKTIENVCDGYVETKRGSGYYSYKITDLKATKEEAEKEAEANLNKYKKERIENIKTTIKKLTEELEELKQ